MLSPPSGGGATDIASGTGSGITVGDALVGIAWAGGMVPGPIGGAFNLGLAAYYAAKGQWGQATISGIAGGLSLVGIPGGSGIAEGVEALSAADEVSTTAVQAASDSIAAESTVSEGTQLYRVFGNEARGLGNYYTTVDPSTVADYRTTAGLFPGNSGSFVLEGILNDTEGVSFQSAAPGPGGVGGGLPEVFVPNPASQINIQGVLGVNPPF